MLNASVKTDDRGDLMKARKVTTRRILSLGCAALAFVVATSHLAPAYAGTSSGSFLVAQRSIKAPPGFSGLCAKYNWACASTGHSALSNDAVVKLATKVNRQVNRQVRQIEDQQQYGKEEHWALPTSRGGDCEDLVLLKKKMLVERGVAAQDLLIATVLDRRLNSHAVLILRTQSGDLVLDNLTNKIVAWEATGYTFLKLQNPKALSRWDAVLAGGLITDKPTASR